MDDPRLAAQEAGHKAFLEVPCGLKDAVTAAINAALDAADPLRQPVPADTIPDAAVKAMQKSLRGNGWGLYTARVDDDLRQALAAALPHLAPHPSQVNDCSRCVLLGIDQFNVAICRHPSHPKKWMTIGKVRIPAPSWCPGMIERSES